MASGSGKRANTGGSGDKDSAKSPRLDPLVNEVDDTIDESDLKRCMKEAIAAQLPRLIIETSKVVTEQLASQSEGRSFISFSQEMRLIRQRQEELATETKAASLRSEGKISCS